MKKLTRIILIFVFAIACSLALPNKGMAVDNTPETAYDIWAYDVKTVFYDSSAGDNQKWFEFTAPETRTYEFEALNPCPETSDWEGTRIRIYRFLEDIPNLDYIGSAYMNDDSDECIAYAHCIEGETYYFVVYNYANYDHNMHVRVKKHIHRWVEDWWGNGPEDNGYWCKECDDWREFDLSRRSYTYDGKIHEPYFIITPGNGIFIPTESYDETYLTECKNVGSHKVRVNIEFYGDSEWHYLYRTFRINPRGTYITKLNRATRGFTVRWARQSRKMSTSRITGYKIRYSRNSSMSNAKTVTVKGYKNTYKKISKLSKNKTYYVQVRTYKVVKGRTYYSTWSKKKAVKTR